MNDKDRALPSSTRLKRKASARRESRRLPELVNNCRVTVPLPVLTVPAMTVTVPMAADVLHRSRHGQPLRSIAGVLYARPASTSRRTKPRCAIAFASLRRCHGPTDRRRSGEGDDQRPNSPRCGHWCGAGWSGEGVAAPDLTSHILQMCGKFTQMYSWSEVHVFSQPIGAVRSDTDEVVVSTPMRMANIMRLNAAGDREMVPMRWGFAGAGDANPGRPKHMHARGETVDRLRTFADAFIHRRGILFVQTFNEGEELPNGKTKQWVITPNDGQPIAIAVIYETRQNGPETLDTFVQVTVPANTLIARITDRMPAILSRDTWTAWLGETDASLAELKAVLQTHEDGGTWTTREEKPPKPPRPPKQKAQQELF